MSETQPFVPPHIADRVVEQDDAGRRAEGAAVVALQIRISFFFSRLLWLVLAVSAAAVFWFHSWIPVAAAALVLAFAYCVLFVVMARRVAARGMLQEYQAAYKRLYYRDDVFKQQVKDLLARKK